MKEKDRDRNNQLPLSHPQMETWPATQARVLTGNGTGDLSVHGPALNTVRRSSQGQINIFYTIRLTNNKLVLRMLNVMVARLLLVSL